MNRSNLHDERSKVQANAAFVENEEENLKGYSLLPPSFSFSSPKEEESDDQQEEVLAPEAEKESVASILQTADDESPSENNNPHTGGNGNSSEPFQLKKSTAKTPIEPHLPI